MPNYAILLAPSEGKEPGGNPLAPDMFDYRSSNTFNYFHELNAERRALIDVLQASLDDPKAELQKRFGAKGAGLEEAIRINREIYTAPLMSALDRYSAGVMYEAMDFAALPTGAQRRLLENGVIFSGLFGLLRPDDLIPNYKLRIDATLPGIGKVAHYWRERMSDLLNERIAGRLIWNLLPKAHQEAWEDGKTYREIVTVRFLHKQGGKYKAVTHNVKPLRGRLVNYIVRELGDEIELLEEWTHPDGYVLDKKRSSFDEEARHRKIVMVKR